MPGTLPPTLGFGGSSGSLKPQTSAHAQNFSTTKLNQHKEREAASTSMGRVIREKQYGRSGGATTSIDHAIHGDTRSSEDDMGMFSEEQREEIRTRLRYKNIRRMMKEKRAAEAAAKKAALKKKGIHIKTGGTYSKEGYGGTKKTLDNMYHKGKHSKFKNLSKSDRKHLEEVIEEGGAHGLVGGSYSYSSKKAMGQAAWKKYKRGDISKQDYKSFKGVIRNLD